MDYLGALWAYTKFVVERRLLPPVEFTIDCNILGKQEGKFLVEILFRLKNVGNSTLVATDIKARIRYINVNEEVKVFSDTSKPTFAHVAFPYSYSKEVLSNAVDSPSMDPDRPVRHIRAAGSKSDLHIDYCIT